MMTANMQRGTEKWYAKSHAHIRLTDQVNNIEKLPLRLAVGHTIGTAYRPMSLSPSRRGCPGNGVYRG